MTMQVKLENDLPLCAGSTTVAKETMFVFFVFCFLKKVDRHCYFKSAPREMGFGTHDGFRKRAIYLLSYDSRFSPLI